MKKNVLELNIANSIITYNWYQQGEESTFVLFIQIAIVSFTAEFFQVHGVRNVAKKPCMIQGKIHDWSDCL